MKWVALALLVLGVGLSAWGFLGVSGALYVGMASDLRFVGVAALVFSVAIGILTALMRKVEVEGESAIASMGPSEVEFETDIPEQFRDDGGDGADEPSDEAPPPSLVT